MQAESPVVDGKDPDGLRDVVEGGAGQLGPGFAEFPDNYGYVASKHAEIGLTKSTALDYAHLGIRASAHCARAWSTLPPSAEMINGRTRNCTKSRP